MKKEVLLLSITTLLLIAVMVIPVSAAQTIQIASPNSLSQQDVMVYNYNGTFYGRYNTTSLITLADNTSYIFTLKPQYANPLDDPVTWLQTSFSYVSTYATPLIIIIFLIGLLYLGRK
jgi:hypothetical protein